MKGFITYVIGGVLLLSGLEILVHTILNERDEEQTETRRVALKVVLIRPAEGTEKEPEKESETEHVGQGD